MKKNINLKNNISSNYFNKNLYLKDLKKLNIIFSNIFYSINNKKNTFHSLSNKFNFNFKYSELKKFNKYRSIILIGMGGSSLGAEAIYSFCNDKVKKNFIFLNNLDQIQIDKIKKKINFKDILFIIVSKSGNTLETLINSNLFKNKILSKNSIIITEKKISLLRTFATNRKILLIDHKNYIGGRYSVLSEVGMIPAYFMGLKIKSLRKNLFNCFKTDKKKLLLDSVSKLGQIYRSKKINSIILLNYAPEFNDFLYWCQQLLAESLGKKGKGILPVVSPSPKDHHSLMQLYLDGPKDKLFYIFSLKPYSKKKTGQNIFGKNFNYVENKSLPQVKEAQKNALIKVLKKKNIPYREFVINKKNEETIGELFSYFIMETTLIAKLIGVDPFNQPAVEQVKVLTKKYLS